MSKFCVFVSTVFSEKCITLWFHSTCAGLVWNTLLNDISSINIVNTNELS